MKISKALFLLSVVFLWSCTTDEVPDNPQIPSSPTLLTGQFLEPPVEGIRYRSGNEEGTTNANGEFRYEEGEMVEFFVGDIKIGEAVGSDKLTPVDIAGTPNASINSEEVKNIAAFLQTMDIDSNPQNGIKITAEVVEALPEIEINFQDLVITILGEIALEVNLNTLANIGVTLPEKAALNLAEALGEDYEISGLEAGPFFDKIENWEGRSANLQWIHEFDLQGRISKSTAYTKYPIRVVFINTYSEYNSAGYPQKYESERVREDGSVSFSLAYYLTYSQGAEISTIAYGLGGGNHQPSNTTWKIVDFDSKMRVTTMHVNVDDEQVGTQYFEYDDQNNSTIVAYYEIGKSEPKNVQEYFLTHFGSISIQKLIYSQTYSESRYFYRENYTREKIIAVSHSPTGPDHTTISHFDETGLGYRMEQYSADFLYKLTERNTDGSSETTFYNEEDGSYYIEYRNTNNQKYKTEYFDSEGNLVETVE